MEELLEKIFVMVNKEPGKFKQEINNEALKALLTEIILEIHNLKQNKDFL